MSELVCDEDKMSVFMSDRLMCDRVSSIASVFPCVFDVFLIFVKSERDIGKVICMVCTENGTVICDSCQYWFEFLSVFKSQIPCINVMKNI